MTDYHHPHHFGTPVKLGLILLTLLFGLLIFPRVGFTPLFALEPLNDTSIRDPWVRFGWSGQASELIIDENPAFSSPRNFSVSGTSYRPEEPLPAGTYYWKLRGKGETIARTFTIPANADLHLAQDAQGTLLRNNGTVDLEVMVRDASDQITGAFMVPVGMIRRLPGQFPQKIEAKEHEE